MFRVLVIEDDEAQNRALCTFLRQNGYEVCGILDARGAYDELSAHRYDIVISDIMMPGIDGFELTEAIRRLDGNVPIMFTTARDDFASKQRGFRVGVDDYMVKPLDFDELLLRMSALLRRAGIAAEHRIMIGNLSLDADEHSAYVNGQSLDLTVREFDLLFKLLSNPRKTFTRAQLMGEFWDADSTSGTRTVDVYVTKLRQKLKDRDGFDIVTVHGFGYKAVPR